MRTRCSISALAALTAGIVGVSPAIAQSQPKQLYADDSIAVVGNASVSSDGRWLVFAASNEGKGSSLWVVATSGGKPKRLTSEGYTDLAGPWFMAGDRIVFASNRPSRNGDRLLYQMTLGFDKATGQAVGVPRQLSTESIKWGGYPAPSGRWITYVRNEAGAEQLKLIPTNGGAPRVLASIKDANIRTMHFSRDERFVYFTEEDLGAPTQTWRLRRVALQNGRPETLVTADHFVQILPADPRYAIHAVAGNSDLGQRFEIRTLDGKLVSQVALPRGSWPSFSGDGWGFMGVQRNWTGSVHLTSLATGTDRVLISGKHSPTAWMRDGAALITERLEGSTTITEVIPIAGGVTTRIPLPPAAAGAGWNSSVEQFYSFRVVPSPVLGTAGHELHVVDLRSGQTKPLSRSVTTAPWAGGTTGAFVYADRTSPEGPVNVRNTDPASGASRVIRTFPAGFKLAAQRGLWVHGDRIVYTEQQRDSIRVYLTEGSTGEPIRLADFRLHRSDAYYGPYWSTAGTRLAIPGTFREHGGKSSLVIIDVPAARGELPRQRSIDTGDECGSAQWLPDDSGLLLLCYPESGPTLVKVNLSDGRKTVVKAGSNEEGPWDFSLSPDGRHVAYTMQRIRGSSVMVLDLRALLPK